MIDLTVVILTGNEKRHIGRCLERLLSLFDSDSKFPEGRVIVVDSESTDGTQEIARSFGADVVVHPWPGYQAKQFNWAIDTLAIKTKWILRLDADEYLYPETIEEVKQLLSESDQNSASQLSEDVTSFSMTRARIWQGRRIRRGTGEVVLTRFFRTGVGRSEDRVMDEHIVTSHGRDLLLKGQFADDNLIPLREWTVKHLDYAEREAQILLAQEYGDPNTQTPKQPNTESPDGQAGSKRRMKGRYGRLPLFWRSFAYFLYRYFLRGGFLEGRAGFTWHFFQGWWYRSMVDARIDEIKRECRGDAEKIREYLDAHAKGR